MIRFTRILNGNALALIALFFALSGTAVAAGGLVTGAKIQDESVTGADILNGSLTGADVDESSLAQVASAADADRLAGKPSDSYLGLAPSLGKVAQTVTTSAAASFSIAPGACSFTTTFAYNVAPYSLVVPAIEDGGAGAFITGPVVTSGLVDGHVEAKVQFCNLGAVSATKPAMKLYWFNP